MAGGRLARREVIPARQRSEASDRVQRLRDEVHRFAIGAHRAKRAKAVSLTPLDDIPGIGATRKRALLQHFGSAKAVARAGVEDLQAVDGISQAMAKTIADYFSAKG